MGNAACCSGLGGDESEITLDSKAEPSNEQYSKWMQNYGEGATVDVLFPEQKTITCILTVSGLSRGNFSEGQSRESLKHEETEGKSGGNLSLAYGEKVRTIPFNEIGGIVTKEDSRLAAEAIPLLNDTKTVGLKLLNTGKAIALRFPTEMDTLCFIKFVSVAIA